MLKPSMMPRNDDDDDDDDDEGCGTKSKSRQSRRAERELLERHRTIFISEEVSPALSGKIIPQLLWLDTLSNEPIKLYINTPGGSADDGFAIHDAIRFIRSPVHCISVGLNASAGTIILLGSPRDRRFALPNCRIMIHQPAGGVTGKASDIEITADQILQLRARANRLIAFECGKPLAQVEADTNNDYWLTPERALEYGLIGKILKTSKDI
ncbi:MAG: ClpP family protease [Planctomycetota bacterium]